MLFTNRDLIRAYIRREKSNGEGLSDDEDDDAQETMEEAHKDVVRHCIQKMNNQKPYRQGDV